MSPTLCKKKKNTLILHYDKNLWIFYILYAYYALKTGIIIFGDCFSKEDFKPDQFSLKLQYYWLCSYLI